MINVQYTERDQDLGKKANMHKEAYEKDKDTYFIKDKQNHAMCWCLLLCIQILKFALQKVLVTHVTEQIKFGYMKLKLKTKVRACYFTCI